jgi:hypothetical protein
MTANDEKWRTTLKEMIAEHRELEKLIPLHTPKRRKGVPKSELWNRSEREELSKLAEAFLKAKKEEGKAGTEQ